MYSLPCVYVHTLVRAPMPALTHERLLVHVLTHVCVLVLVLLLARAWLLGLEHLLVLVLVLVSRVLMCVRSKPGGCVWCALGVRSTSAVSYSSLRSWSHVLRLSVSPRADIRRTEIVICEI